jgi:hypothetical protein
MSFFLQSLLCTKFPNLTPLYTTKEKNMPEEKWMPISGYPDYLISDVGRVYNRRSESIMAESRTLQGDHKVTLSSMGDRSTRSVRVLVAEAFVPRPPVPPTAHKSAIPNTVIVLDNNQENVASYNLAWRPRWFAHKYARQFNQKHPEAYHHFPVRNERTGVLFSNIIMAATCEGLLFNDVYKSATTGMVVYPTDSTFKFA